MWLSPARLIRALDALLLMIQIILTAQDDPQFVEIISRILNGAVLCYKPAEIYLIQIDSWFDHKWKSFSGVIDLQLGTWLGPLLRVPPFNPHRVVSEVHFQVNEQSQADYVLSPASYMHIFQSSDSNLQRRLTQMTKSGLYVWYSCNTQKNDRGSLLLYNIEGERQIAWYISFVRNDGWRINKAKGISKQEAINMMELSDARGGI
jgi:hypothetical protein